MPANYAHNRFGKQVLPTVGPWAEKHRALYLALCHGPDPLFYFDPYGPNWARDLAEEIHDTSGARLFTRLAEQVRQDTEGPGWAALYGLLTHYCLDSSCHPTVNGLVDREGCDHTELETEFDRVLMELDGVKKPYTRDLGKHMRLSKDHCAQAAALLGLSGEDYETCLKKMRRATALVSGRVVPLWVVERAIRNAGPAVRHQLMCRQENPNVAPYIPRLLKRYEEGLARFPVLARQLDALLRNGTPLGEEFIPHFN